MMGYLHCIIYLAMISMLVFITGRLLPGEWFDPQRFPYRCLDIETERLYRRLGVPKWQKKLPDMSRLCRRLMPPKRLTPESSLPQMIRETCIAEWAHNCLLVLGFGCIRLLPGKGGVVLSVLYAIGNVPFILVQRYNRPRLVQLFHKVRGRSDENPHPQPEYRAGA